MDIKYPVVCPLMEKEILEDWKILRFYQESVSTRLFRGSL